MDGRRALAVVSLTVLLSACSMSSQDSDKVGMMCLRGHDEIIEEVSEAEFVCDEYVPSPGVTP